MVLGGKGELREAEGAWNEYTNILFSELDLYLPLPDRYISS